MDPVVKLEKYTVNNFSKINSAPPLRVFSRLKVIAGIQDFLLIELALFQKSAWSTVVSV
jgi:hypothetical protein